jgi:hypothetical protein
MGETIPTMDFVSVQIGMMAILFGMVSIPVGIVSALIGMVSLPMELRLRPWHLLLR